MKRFFLIHILIASLALVPLAIAGTPSPQIDTLTVDSFGKLNGFIASWGTRLAVYSATTTADTMSCPGAAQWLHVIAGGANTDTIQISLVGKNTSSVYRVGNSSVTVLGGETASFDLSPASFWRVIVKATGTVRVRLKAIGKGK